MDRIPGGVTFIEVEERLCAQKRFDVKKGKKCLVVLERGPMLLVASLMMRVYLLAVGSDGKPLLVQLDKIDLSNVPSMAEPGALRLEFVLACCLFVPANLPHD